MPAVPWPTDGPIWRTWPAPPASPIRATSAGFSNTALGRLPESSGPSSILNSTLINACRPMFVLFYTFSRRPEQNCRLEIRIEQLIRRKSHAKVNLSGRNTCDSRDRCDRKSSPRSRFVLEMYGSQSKGSINQHGHFQTELMGLDVEVKDASRFPDKWAYFGFDADEKSSSATSPGKNDCWKCHDQNAAVEHTFVQFYPALLSIAREKKTIKDGVKLP